MTDGPMARCRTGPPMRQRAWPPGADLLVETSKQQLSWVCVASDAIYRSGEVPHQEVRRPTRTGIESRPAQPRAVVLSEAHSVRIDQELTKVYEAARRDLAAT